jgi:hypothetical protein
MSLIVILNLVFVKPLTLEIAHESIQRVYLLQNWVEAQSYWAVLFAKTANAIGLLPGKRDTGNLQFDNTVTHCQVFVPVQVRANFRPKAENKLWYSVFGALQKLLRP